MASKLSHLSVTADVTTASAKLKSLICTGNGAAGVAVIREGGSGGTIKATLRAASADSVSWTAADPNGIHMADGIHVTITTAEVTVEWE